MKKRVVVLVMLILALAAVPLGEPLQVSAKSNKKNIVIAKITGNTLSYHKAANVTKIMKNPDWENIVGYGKKKKIKLSKNTKFYLLNVSTMKNYKVSKKKFIKKLFDYSKNKEQGVTWYWGTYCKMTIKKGKCVKLVQGYQA